MDLLDTVSVHKPKISFAVGSIFMVLGLGLMNPLASRLMGDIFLFLGGVFIAASIPWHFEVSRKSTLYEKAFVVALAASVLLISAGAITYNVVNVEYQIRGTSQGGYAGYQFNDFASMYLDPRSVAPGTGVTPHAIPHLKVDFIVTHVQAGHAAVLFELGLALFVLSMWIKSKFL